jgi:hypothetical protein
MIDAEILPESSTEARHRLLACPENGTLSRIAQRALPAGDARSHKSVESALADPALDDLFARLAGFFDTLLLSW